MTATLAMAAAELAALVFKKRDEETAHQCFRIKNLHPNEIATLVKQWPEIAEKNSLTDIRLLVTSDLAKNIPVQFIADNDKTITYYRNNNPQGLIYVESAVQGDEQGLQNIFSLRDSNFLDGSFDEYAESKVGVPELLIRHAWAEAQERNTSVPTLLIEHIVAVLKSIHPHIETIPVRKFIAFVELCISEWFKFSPVVDGTGASSIVGRGLCALGMFPDEAWNVSEAKIQRRLELNLRYAELIDGGVELTIEDLLQRIGRTTFKDTQGNPLTSEEAQRFRKLCIGYSESPTDFSIREQIPYDIFSQLFAKDTAGLLLGDRVYEEITSKDPSRVSELLQLDVIRGLNARSVQDAVRFLDHSPSDRLPELKSLLTQATRKSVERLATPPKKHFFNPSLLLVQLCEAVSEEEGCENLGKLRLELRDGGTNIDYTLGLFSFLFGPSLQALQTSVSGLPGALEFEVCQKLITQYALPPITDEEASDEEAELQGQELTSLPVRIIFYDKSDAVISSNDQFEWSPEEEERDFFAVFWILAHAYSESFKSFGLMEISTGDTYEAWVRRIADREQEACATLSLKTSNVQMCSPLIEETEAIRTNFLEQLSATGLEIEAINHYVDVWQSLIAQVTTNVVPNGSRLPDLDKYLSADFISEGGGSRRLMTPLHPIKLRWISTYLAKTLALAINYLSRSATFAGINGDLYLSWLKNLSPRETPPIASSTNGSLVFAKSGVAWWEDYSQHDYSSTNLSYDNHSFSTVVNRIVGYLEAHPYKKDGLSLLVILPNHDQIPARLVSQIKAKSSLDVRVSLTVVTPRSRWEVTAKHLEQLPTADESSSSFRIFPPIDLCFIDPQDGAQFLQEVSSRLFDIGIVSHILEKGISVQQVTEMPLERPGHYDVLRHRPLRLTSEMNGSMSLVMLPAYKDPVLEAWSTLVVRNHRTKPVSPEQPENIDLIELKVNFQDSAEVFRSLHDCCHWVITLERHISRDQLESIEAGSPDILSLETGIGENQDNTLVVSSKSGRMLICAKLRRKLERMLSLSTRLASPGMTQRLAEDIYESTRHFSPRLALQALGVTRATEELFGLTIARKLAEAQVVSKPLAGLTIWISLDDHAKWFGGTASIRADICRLTLEYVDQNLFIDVLVVEGKLRQAFDEHGIHQVQRTKQFFEEVFGASGDRSSPHIDSEMWREELATAVEEAPAKTVTFFSPKDRVDLESTDTLELKVRALADIRSGGYSLREVRGLYSICLWEDESNSIDVEECDGIRIVKCYRNHILDILSPKIPGAQFLDPAKTPRNVDSVGELLSPALQGEKAPTAEVNSTGETTVEVMRKKLPYQELIEIYNKILESYALHKVDVTKAENGQEFVEGPASILFRVKPSARIDPKKLQEKGSALKIALALEEDQNISFGIDRGYVTIDVPKRPEQRYFVDAHETWGRWERPPSGLAVPIGEDRYGNIVDLDFSSPNSPHLLVAGTTGSGKSEALNSILFGLTHFYEPHELQLLLIDPKSTELVAFEGSEYLFGEIGWQDADAIQLLKLAVEEMERRYSEFKSLQVRSIVEYNSDSQSRTPMPWWLIVLDEYADLTSDPQSKKTIEQDLKRLAAKARAAGIHIIIATQKPSAEVISTTLRSNLPAQLALKVRSGIESRVVMDESGAENLNGKGDALLRKSGAPIRVQCAKVA